MPGINFEGGGEGAEGALASSYVHMYWRSP